MTNKNSRTAALFGLRRIRNNPQHSVPVALLTLYLSVWLIAPRHRPPPASSPLPPFVVVAAPAPPDPVPEAEEPPSHYVPRLSLLRHARRITTIRKDLETCCWLSSTRLLLIYNAGGSYEFPDQESWRGYAELFDTRTGRHHRLKGLNRLLNRLHCVPGAFRPSPDGKWLWWCRFYTGDQWPNPAVAHLDGSGYQHSGMDRFSETYWLNNNCWVEQETRPWTTNTARLVVHNLKHPNEAQVIPLGSAKAQRLLRLLGSRQGFRFVSDWQADSRSRGRLNITQALATDYAEVPKALHTYHLALPDHAQSLDYDGEKILAWPDRNVFYHLSYRALPPSSRQPSGEAKPVPVEDVWVSHANGSRLRDLGYIAISENAGAEDRLTDLQWLPDGKRLSFCYKGALWNVRVE